MPAQVAPGAADTICDFAEGFIVHVTGASDVDAVVRALALARGDILAMAAGPEGEAIVSNPALAPGGPLVRVSRLGVDDDVLRTIPSLIAHRLDEQGVTQATITAPEPGGGAVDALDSCPNAAVLRLFPDPAGPDGVIPAGWIDVACEWVLGDLPPTARVMLRLLGAAFDVTVAEAPSVLHQACLARAWCDIVSGDLDERVRTASLTFGRAPHVALAAGGPACDGSALVARFDLLCEVARDLAPGVAYACVDLEETFDSVGLGLTSGAWPQRGGASPNLVAGELVDVLVPDAFPYQILGKGHLARLVDGGAATGDAEPPIGELIADGKVEVVLGEAVDWLPVFESRDGAQADGWDELAPVLATAAEADDLLAERPRRQVGSEAPSFERAPHGAGLPDLADITLETLPHARRGLRLTFLELVSWLAHQHHSDAPAGVSPVLATYGRWLASAIGDDRRQELKPLAARTVGTGAATTPQAGAPGGAGSALGGRLAAADATRAWLATDWLVRVQASRWLRLAGLGEAAARLESLGSTADREELVRAVDVLSAAIDIAGRRLDLTAAIAGTDDPDDIQLVEHAAWDAWEEASEASGWVAASEAAAVGVPAELAYATDLRVIECARDSRAREALDAAHSTVGDAAWSAALHAMAEVAWTAGWSAAAPAIDELAVLPLRTALDRATRAAFASAGRDADEREDALDRAEAAAKELLTRAALGPTAGAPVSHPWDAAMAAATSGPDGEVYARVQHLARAAVDEGPWEAGMAAARAAVDAVMLEAPDLVARAVGAAVGREAAGAAARGVALRAAAIARAQGADGTGATEAARSALAPTVAELQDAALALFDDLLDVPPDAGDATGAPEADDA